MPVVFTEARITARVEERSGDARKELRDRRSIPEAIRFEYRGRRCAYCRGVAMQVDHKIPVTRGGTSDRDNLTPCCSRCNQLKGDFTPEEFRRWYERDIGPWPPLSFLDDLLLNVVQPFTRQQQDLLVDRVRWRGLGEFR